MVHNYYSGENCLSITRDGENLVLAISSDETTLEVVIPKNNVREFIGTLLHIQTFIMGKQK